MTFSPDDIAKVTPEHEKFWKELLDSDGGIFNPYGSRSTINFPGTSEPPTGTAAPPGNSLLKQ
jgi:hypothetical protein